MRIGGARSAWCIGRLVRVGLACLVLLAASAGSPKLPAEQRVVQSPGKVPAVARYTPGEQPVQADTAVLFLHGFLQTHQFPTVARQVDTLDIQGLPVLAPNLSLGVPYRERNLPCEALHSHSMDDAIEEISGWVEWLVAEGYEHVVLAGHSFGAVQAMAYLEAGPHPAVKRVIGIGLVDIQRGVGGRVAPVDMLALEPDTEDGETALGAYSLHYCQNNSYRAPPAAYRSYVRWIPARILTVIRETEVPVAVILGDADDRMGEQWMARLRDAGAEVSLIRGADHFFGGDHEIELAETLLDLIAGP